MPRKYVRKEGVAPRCTTWTEESLCKALDELKIKKFGLNEISRRYNIPARTLRRRLLQNNSKKLTLGKHPVLKFENEERLVLHLKELEKSGFSPTPDMIRRLAFEFAEKLGIDAPFNKKTRKAGKQWLQSFLERHTCLSIRQDETKTRALSLNREAEETVYKLLFKVLKEHDLIDEPNRVFSIDQTVVKLYRSADEIIAKQGVKSEITVISCCNAVGNFLPPVVIADDVHITPDFLDGLPPGSEVYINETCAYYNGDLFHRWLVEHFVFRKPKGKVILIHDDNSSNTNDILKSTEENDIILFHLPSNTKEVLGPLELGFHKQFKTLYANEIKKWMMLHKDISINPLIASKLIGSAWIQAATTLNAVSGFRASGIYPFNPASTQDSFFAISDVILNIPEETKSPAPVPSPTKYSSSDLSKSYLSDITSPKMTRAEDSFKFNDEETLKFLKLYRAEPALWDPNNSDNQQLATRRLAIERIVQNMGIPNLAPRHIRLKIKTYRDMYIRESRKKTSKFRKPPLWLKEMRFLDKVRQNQDNNQQQSSDTDSMDVSENTNNSCPESKGDKPITTECPIKEESDINENDSNIDYTEEEVLIPTNYMENYDEKQHTLESMMNILEKLQRDQETLLNTVKCIKKDESKEDFCDNLGKYIATLLRLLPKAKAYSLQPKIIALITAELEANEENK